jgi:hypothetical protein
VRDFLSYKSKFICDHFKGLTQHWVEGLSLAELKGLKCLN